MTKPGPSRERAKRPIVPPVSAPDDEYVISRTGFNVVILDPRPNAAEIALNESVATIEHWVARRRASTEGRPQREEQRKVLVADMLKAGVPPRVVVGVYSYVEHQVEVLVLRKDLNALVRRLASEVSSRRAARSDAQTILGHLDAILGTESPLMTGHMRETIDTVRREIQTETPCLRREDLERLIAEGYDACPGKPFAGRSEDLAWLLGRFWEKGRLKILKPAARRPRTDPWPDHVAAIVSALVQGGVSENAATTYVARILVLEFVATGLVPQDFEHSFKPDAIRALMKRRRKTKRT